MKAHEDKLTSERTFTRERAIGVSDSGSKKDIALPVFPQRPVRPIRWTYSSMEEGRSKFTTCCTCSISSPRAATEVATRTGHFPVRKSPSACSLSLCSRSLQNETMTCVKVNTFHLVCKQVYLIQQKVKTMQQ